MRRLLRDNEVELEVDQSGIESGTIIGGYTPLALCALVPYALHLTRESEPLLWWHEKHNHPGSHEGERSVRPVDPWDCFLRFCALHDATDEAVFNFAERYGILGIWPRRSEFCVTDLPPLRRRQLEVPWEFEHAGAWEAEIWGTSQPSDIVRTSLFVTSYDSWEEDEQRAWREGPGKLEEEYVRRLERWREECLQNEHLYADPQNCVWYGEPTSLWRRLAKHLRALARIGAMLHRGELGAETDWEAVLLPGELGCRYSRDDEGGWHPTAPFEAQRVELEDLINRWLPNVTARLYLRGERDGKMGIRLEAGYFEESSWTPQDYEECAVRGLASSDLRAQSGWNRDNVRDFDTRPSLLLNILILQLTALVTAGASVCPRCGNPAPATGPSGKRLPIAKTYCGEGCKAEARKETKRNTWRKAQRGEGGAIQ